MNATCVLEEGRLEPWWGRRSKTCSGMYSVQIESSACILKDQDWGSRKGLRRGFHLTFRGNWKCVSVSVCLCLCLRVWWWCSLARVVSLEAFWQWDLLSVQITRHYPTSIQIHCTEVHLFFRKDMLGLFMFLLSTELWHGLWRAWRDDSYVCVYTQGLGKPTASQHNMFDSKKLSLSCARDGVRTSGHGILSPMLYWLSHPVTLIWLWFRGKGEIDVIFQW